MSRSLSSIARQALFAQETGEVFIVLLTIDHPQLSTPIRVCSDAVQCMSRGNVFVAFPFDIVLPNDSDAPPQASLQIDNVSQEIAASIRSIGTPPSVTIEVVRASAPDTVEASLPAFQLTNVRYDTLLVQGDLVTEDLTSEPFPADMFTPSNFPGLF